MLAHAPQLKLDEVHTIDKVTAEWLTTVLGVPGAKVEDVTTVGAHEGMTSRHKLELTWSEGTAAELPSKIFIKITPENPHLREMLAVLHMAELEAAVYTVLQEELNDVIPKSYHARSYPGGRFVIILEDLESRGIKPYWIKDDCSLSHAREVAVALAKIHSRYWDTERFTGDMVWVRPRPRRFGGDWVSKFFEGNRERFLETDAAKGMTEYARALLQEWTKSYATVYNYWETKPQTLLHGDSHLGNTLAYADGTAGLYDWQCLFRGYGYRDLAYFLMTALQSADLKAHEREIFDLYTDTLEQNGVKVDDREHAWRDYCLFILDPLDAIIATLTNGGYGHDPETVERQVRTTVDALERHDVKALLEKVIKTGSV
ncbi:kinase-like protein [Mytilinidion resinicola]|uniref:Kinase-like protein n=1 Tax=Mytilinidion resinicola TaxID=574789 RepID=A0A6A6YHT7_9PEZI|nr:kinase-like protein [Mytilinidion resinicola]KAF2807564.1 kinase-like protein [Mytilinidion resinicola]